MINPLKKKTKQRAEIMGLLDMANKVDELVKVLNKLQAKEEASKGECNHGGDVHIASNLETDARLYISDGKGGFVHSLKELQSLFPNPPEHEETKDEEFQAKLDIAEERGYWEGRLETELKKPISKKRASQINENRLFAENVKSGGMKEVTDEYVSKEKIKREITNLQIKCNKADGIIDGVTALHTLLEGLGD